jgi:hypothetical protein
MLLAKIENNVVTQVDDSSKFFPNTSFPVTGIDLTLLQENSLVEVESYPELDSATQKIEPTAPYLLDGRVYSYKIVAKTQEDYDLERGRVAYGVRFKRNELLKASDWTQIADATVDKQAWLIYRQALRDVTAQAGFPFDIIWPDTPTA